MIPQTATKTASRHS